MKIYISGQITGLPYEEAEKAFNESETRLKKFGFEVVNPLKKEIPNTASWTEHMRMDIKLLMDCDTIYMLRNFRQSNGAMIEYELAKKLGYTVIRQMSPSTDTVDDIRDTEPFSTGIE
ncbi:DUF4406 domain-containing protein [Massilibacteroides vaginae]|uniref:DUF4406 domain-containing protein n=1 Tax=Massilibacteroides vaginae TaxID=1673718 RepID=UPI000A1CD286|nr:DUF4406 domain-containing protein [Massilibacteroides vaginae]